MTQKAQIIDVRRSYTPIDPNSQSQNLVGTFREDGEEPTDAVAPYEGYNFLPTEYGYRSYFGTSPLSLAALPSRVQECIAYQTPDYKRHYIALCEDGIWVSQADNTWSQKIIHSYDSEVFEKWTHCIIENVLYCYKQGYSIIYKTTFDMSFVVGIESISPTFLNMPGQMGIFKAGTRLGMWDSDNSISWSSTFDFSDFTPAQETLAGNTKFIDVLGKIVSINAHGEGYIIYSTKSIVGASLNLNGSLLWEGRKILSNAGITHSRSVCFSSINSEQYAYTTAGIVKIGKYSPAAGRYEVEWLFPEFVDLIKEDNKAIALTLLHNRYLTFSVADDRYIDRITSFEQRVVDPQKTALVLADGYWDGDITVLPSIMDGNMFKTIIDQWLAQNQPRNMTC
jgi:hypothetical protein